ncbi:MAG: PhoH family protein [Deltaproteobacteria bacterium]|nr:PhoH family protein [Deltaproteobacteria bacterium]
MTASPPAPPFHLKAPVVFVTGKGGVGKTTVAAGLAIQAARAGQTAALVEFDDGQAGARALGRDVSEIAHVVVIYDKALVEALASVLGSRILARAIVSQRAIRRMVRAVPALREFALLERVRALAAEHKYQRIVVDLPSSGHALDWLRVPKAFERFLGNSPLGNMGKSIHREIVAPGRAEIVVVTLAEPLVVKETEELCRRMRSELGIAPALVVVNRTVVADPEGAWSAAKELSTSEDGVGAAARELLQIIEARAEQAEDTAYAFGLARAMDAGHVMSLPDTPNDPVASQVAQWLSSGASG